MTGRPGAAQASSHSPPDGNSRIADSPAAIIINISLARAESGARRRSGAENGEIWNEERQTANGDTDVLLARYDTRTETARRLYSIAYEPQNKIDKYSKLASTHIFYPFAIETAGTWHEMAIEITQEIGRRITTITEDTRETTFLFQRLPMALQRGNAVSFHNTMVTE